MALINLKLSGGDSLRNIPSNSFLQRSGSWSAHSLIVSLTFQVGEAGNIKVARGLYSVVSKSFHTESEASCRLFVITHRCPKIPPPIASRDRHTGGDRQEIRPQSPLLCRCIPSDLTVSKVSCWSAPDSSCLPWHCFSRDISPPANVAFCPPLS